MAYFAVFTSANHFEFLIEGVINVIEFEAWEYWVLPESHYAFVLFPLHIMVLFSLMDIKV